MELGKLLRIPMTSGNSVLQNTENLIKSTLSESSFDSLFTPEVPILENYETRLMMYKMWWAYFDNHIYDPSDMGGYRQIINHLLGSSSVSHLAPIFNPVERCVRAYEYVFDGAFGEKIKIDEKVDERPVNEKILEPIKNIWKWSNIEGWKIDMLTKTAALGSCGLRIQYRNDDNGKRIFMTPEHPSVVRFIERDERDNITQIVLQYEKEEGEFLADDDNRRTTHRYTEYMSREKFWMQRDNQWFNPFTRQLVNTKEEATVENRLGIVPYILITQTRIGGDFGVPCFYGHERQIDQLNALTARINYQIHKHVSGTWLIEGGGPPPTMLTLGDQVIWYVQKEIGTTSQVSVHDLVSKMSLGEAIEQQTKIHQELKNALPEMKATDGEFLSHQSGGTVAQLRTPAEQRILIARTNIEAAFIKAQQIALSLGILQSMWDLGTGMGTRARADKAYAEGRENHKFNDRPALPLTVDDQLTVAKADQATAAANNPDTPGVAGGNNKPIPTSSTSGG